ncbi:MAG TPA: hypothetical protein VE987_10120 [Polyangiaceae bacterium]|nr:hypothetical protein [Polyangiaceae bacterium]
MAKDRGSQSSQSQGKEQSGRERGRVTDSPHAFMQAFADALRDILLDERRRVA